MTNINKVREKIQGMLLKRGDTGVNSSSEKEAWRAWA